MGSQKSFVKDIGRLREIEIALKYQLKSYIRTRKFIVLFILIALISAAVFVFEAHTGVNAINAQFNSASNYLYSFMQNIVFTVILAAAFFGGGAISTDFASNYSYFILVQPARRSSLLIGRYIAAFIVSFGVALVYYLFGAVASFYFFSTIPLLAFSTSIGLTALLVLSVLSFAFFLSSLFNSPQTSTIAVVILLIIALPIVSGVLQQFAVVEPWFLINYGGQVVYNVFSTHFVHFSQMKISGAHDFIVTHYEPYVNEGIEIILGYAIVFFLGSVFIYRRKEVKT